MSHPVWVRGLKRAHPHILLQSHLSHPVWVRGLKLYSRWHFPHARYVAPRVGAWIETNDNSQAKAFGASHPVWVRGLKRHQEV